MSKQEYKDNELLCHILDAIENVATHQSSGGGKFTVERAIIYELVIIGEVVGDLSGTLKEAHKRVPWQVIADTRHKMVHDYEDVSSKIVWNIVEEHLPELKRDIESILKVQSGT